MLLRIGDESSIAAELLDGPVREDAFTYARRGADALMTRGRDAARQWYNEALSASRDGDEKTAALYGLQVTREPGDWSSIGDLDEQRLAILPAERPRVEKLWELERDAAEALLAARRSGRKRGGSEPTQAIEKLREALVAADDMGWPKCPGPNHTTAADGLAYAIVGLCLTEGSALDGVKTALTIVVERGLLSLERHIDDAVLDRIQADPRLADWVRHLLETRPEAMYMRRSRGLLRSALLPVLSDAGIDAHVLNVVPATLPDRNFQAETPTEELHLALLRRQFRAMPRAAALRMMELVGNVLSGTHLGAVAHADWLRVPLFDWIKIGTIAKDDAQLTAVKLALESAFGSSATSSDPFARRTCLRLLDQLKAAEALSSAEVGTFRSLLDAEIALYSTPARQDEPQETLEFVRIRAELGEWTPPPALRGMFANAYLRLRNSTATGTWMNAVNLLAPILTREDRSTVARNIDEYLEACLKMRGRFLAPDPSWAATGVHQAAQARIFSADEAKIRLLRLAREFPGCAAFVLGLDGIDPMEAEAVLLQGIVDGTADETDTLQWCNWWPDNQQCCPTLQSTLLGQLFCRDPEIRRAAYLGLGILAQKGALSAEVGQALARAIFDFGLRDRHWGPRAGAVVAASRIAGNLAPDQVEKIAVTAAADDAAQVRRVAELLRTRRP